MRDTCLSNRYANTSVCPGKITQWVSEPSIETISLSPAKIIYIVYIQILLVWQCELSYVHLIRNVWDEPKRHANVLKHGLDFASLTLAFFEDALIEAAQQDRYIAIGKLEEAQIIVVVFRPLGSEGISIISMRRASRTERNRL